MEDTQPSRYVVGIDLGTTNCALSFVDTESDVRQVENFSVPQWVDLGQRESRETLPSFHYELTEDERSGNHQLPWQKSPSDFCVGVWAREAGHRQPGRRTASAKSWLSHDGVDRTADLLPWHGDSDVQRLSPVEASSRYLAHLRAAWDHAHPDAPLKEQDVVITLPASFDEVARELTVAAAKKAGLPRIYLIEEPQAAFYAWIDRQGDDWQDKVRPGQLILVCDIGGGTTDLTLIRVRSAGDDGAQVQFHRVAVGSHLILGGDNLDLAVAKLAESKITGGATETSLSPAQWDRLVQVARGVKEAMLSADRGDTYTIHLPSEGSQLIGGGLQVELTAEEVDEVLLDGFFPQVELSDKPARGESGFQEFGLPYAADAAITRHLAEFLSTHRHTGVDENDPAASVRPELVLFNGGVMTSPAIGARIVESLSRWFSGDGSDADWQPEVLESPRLDLAVARGAAYYGLVRRGDGVRIAANLGHSYYMQVGENPPKGLCLIPGSAEAGQRFQASEHPLQLQIGSPVQFPLWVSSTRLADTVGELIDIDRTELSPLPPICTALVQGRRREDASIHVVIESELSEIGTVGLFCVAPDSGKRWKLEFDIRSTLETDRQAHAGAGETAGIIDSETSANCEQAIATVFDPESSEPKIKPSQIVKRLQSITEMHRNEWPPSLLRQQWQYLFDHESGRRRSQQHESRWLNLVGFCLRPGYGIAVDDWRVSSVWKAIHNKLAFPAASSRTESMIMWRRIAGGLSSGQQSQLAAPWLSSLKNRSIKLEPHEANEVWRLAGSLERLAVIDKVGLGRAALAALGQKKNEKIRHALLWSIGRLGSRQPLYGPLNTTIPVDEAIEWTEQLIQYAAREKTDDVRSLLSLALVQIGRVCGDRFRDLPPAQRQAIAEMLRDIGASEHLMTLITEGGKLASEEQAAIFGDSLPLGIRLVR